MKSGCFAAAALCIGSPGLRAAPFPHRDATLRVSAVQLFAIADAALARGDVVTARHAYSALTDDPDVDIRSEARFRLAMLERKRGNLARAATLLRQILDERPSAARVRLELAAILDQLGDTDGAWRQLRAAQAGGLPLNVARQVDRYSEALRARRAFGASFGVAIAPDTNINRATRQDTLGTVFGDFDIARDAKAKSGVGIAANGQVYRRIPIANDASLLVRFSGFANLYRRKDFDDIAADAAVGPDLNLGRNRLQLELGATERWFGLKPFTRSVRIGSVVSRPVGRRTLVRMSGSAALVDNQLNDLQDGKAYAGQASIEHALAPIAGLAVHVGLNRQSLKDPGYSTTGWVAGTTVWRDFGRATITAGLEVGRLHADDRLLLFSEKRSEIFRQLSLSATMRQLQWHGFAPVARLTLERNKSTIAFYDYQRTRTELGLERAF